MPKSNPRSLFPNRYSTHPCHRTMMSGLSMRQQISKCEIGTASDGLEAAAGTKRAIRARVAVWVRDILG